MFLAFIAPYVAAAGVFLIAVAATEYALAKMGRH